MKIVQINTFSNKSTGTIMMSIHDALLNEGIESYVVWGRGRKANNKNEIYMNDKLGVYCHVLYTRITGKTGFLSKRNTKKLIQKLDEIKPDIIHLHNIHGYYINIEILFNYIKKNNIKVVWTLHDCWAFTGHCTHFDMVKCNKWKKECNICIQKNIYPKSFKDSSNWNYKKKKDIFSDLDMTIVTPSKWLENLVKQSFLKNYKVKVINNGIDTNIFKPRNSDFRIKYNLENKKIILGVASDWSEKKGLNDFILLSQKLNDEFKIVLVGLNKKQIKKMPNNIIKLEKTNSAIELAEIYSSSDIYFNASKEETFGMTTIEALSCGIPVIVYNCTALPEIIKNNNGFVVNEGKIQEVINAINIIAKKEKKIFFKNEYTKFNMTKNYIDLYNFIQMK